MWMVIPHLEVRHLELYYPLLLDIQQSLILVDFAKTVIDNDKDVGT